MKACFQVDSRDNVATALEGFDRERVRVFGAVEPYYLDAREAVELGHKIATRPIAAGAEVIKYGVAIGLALDDIEPGKWVHLHNCRSQVDQRSPAFDPHTGAATDTNYA
jgi:altronate dehydratase small subunit